MNNHVLAEAARAVARAIVTDLEDRRGLGREWRAIDTDTRAEIVATWEAIALEMGRDVARECERRTAALVATTTAHLRAEADLAVARGAYRNSGYSTLAVDAHGVSLVSRYLAALKVRDAARVALDAALVHPHKDGDHG